VEELQLPEATAFEAKERPANVRFAVQEFVRASIAFAFVGLLFFTVVWAFRYVDDDAAWVNTKELLQVLLPAETALLGSAVGFYFGSRRQ